MIKSHKMQITRVFLKFPQNNRKFANGPTLETNKTNSSFLKATSPTTRAHTKRLVALALQEKKLISISLVALCASSAGTLAFPVALGKIIDMVSIGNAAGMNQYIYFLIGVFSLASVSSFARIITMEIATERIIKNLRSKLFHVIINQPIPFFDTSSTGELITRLSTDTTVMSETIVEDFANALKRVVEGIGGLAMLIYISPYMTALILTTVPPLVGSAMYFGKKLKALARKRLDAIGEGTAYAETKINAIRTVKAFVQEEKESLNYTDISHRIFLVGKQKAIFSASFHVGMYQVINLAVTGVLYYGGLCVIEHTLTPGELTSFIIYSWFVVFSFVGISTFWTQFNRVLGSSEKVFRLLDLRVDGPLSDINTDNSTSKLQGLIQFNNVLFSYPERPEYQVLKGLSFTIKPGTTVAIIGTSGCGKSSIVSLLCKFYCIDSGEILVDGKNLNEYAPKWFRSQIALVSQDITLFAGTIAQNISYGVPNATMEEIINASHIANCHDFIQSLPDQYNTQVGEKGMQLSGGQKQRIAIARAVICKPTILILDEATSSLDMESEKLVHAALEKLHKQMTVILISHRLSTLKLADSVIVIKDGRAQEVGTYEQFIQTQAQEFSSLLHTNTE